LPSAHEPDETQERTQLKRLFFALWPDSETRAKCAAISATLKSFGRPVNPDNLHATLVFLGSVDEAIETKLIDSASAVNFAKISIRFDSLNYWRRPRIICLCGKPEDSAAALLVEQLNTLAAALEIPTDDRPYQAHITLLRKANKLPPLAFEPIIWQSDAFCLVESCSTPEGVAYRVLKTWQIPRKPGNADAEPEPHSELTNPNGAIIIDDTSSTSRH
jgi:2'-5' RNA ligase